MDPATILANAAKRLKGKDASQQWRQPDLFAAPFENLPLRQALDFYHHEKGWSNRLVAGDSLLVMNSLLTKESMAGRVQMIYIDPPYGIKYGSNFQPFTNNRSLMPHQVFFPMADAKGGWNRLRKTVRAELDEDLLEQFHGTVSLPFEAGENRRIAVKIVDDRGIESLKIMPLEG